jgi:hypothetical protein
VRSRFLPSIIACSFTTLLALVEPALAAPEENEKSTPRVTFGGYAEAFYQWNFNRPVNGVTNFRGFDNRHNSFTLSNVALDATWDVHDLVGKLTLQVGHTPSTYYLAEPALAGASGANASSAELWKYVQQGYVGYRFGIGRGLLFQMGLFLSPIGPESMAIRDNWNWSRSNLFFGLPFYHTGARLSYPLSDAWTATLAVYNGWNSVVDNNDEKSVSGQITYTIPDKLALSMLYFGGVERPRGAPEGRAWRHLFDTHVTWQMRSWLAILAHVNGGTEQNRFGTSVWIASAIGTRIRLHPKVFLALRGDVFRERAPESSAGKAATIFWPVPWVASGTMTAEFRPHERVSMRLEYRHDEAAGKMFYGPVANGVASTTSIEPDRSYQNTVTLGATTWF